LFIKYHWINPDYTINTHIPAIGKINLHTARSYEGAAKAKHSTGCFNKSPLVILEMISCPITMAKFRPRKYSAPLSAPEANLLLMDEFI
jgi:hypothetical protein